MERDFPAPMNEKAEFGIEVHRCFEAMRSNAPESIIDIFPEDVRRIAAEAVKLLDECGKLGNRENEHPVRRYGEGYVIEGRVDEVRVVADSEIWVWDLKSGYPAERAHENYQLITYAWLLLQDLKNFPEDGAINLGLVAPQTQWQLDLWVTTKQDLQPYFDQLDFAALKASECNPETKAGPHCARCSARFHCDTFERYLSTLEIAGKYEDTWGIPKRGLSTRLKVLAKTRDTAASAYKAGEAEIKALMRQGEDIPGAAFSERFGPRRWKQDAQIWNLAREYNIAVTEYCSPTAVERALAARGITRKEIEATLADYIERPKQNPALKLFEVR